ncbi:MAG: aminotransferase [Pseudomonadota bacterium]
MSEPRFNPHLAATMPPPVMEARRWLEGVEFPPERPLINLSQAAPVDPPPAPLVEAMAQALSDPASHLYGPVLGLPELRAELAAQWSAGYHGQITPSQVAITSGCNQAFVAACATLAGPGDEVLLPCPYYFNHKMWLDMAGVGVGLIPTDASLLPDPEAAAARIGPRTRAIALVSPNNPCGVEYPRELLAKFFELCQARGIALILDETYRDFHSVDGAPHTLFQRPDWAGTLVHLYSFSKAYRLTGHRVGALICAEDHLAQVEKFLDTVAICPPQLGQIAALWGMRNLGDWLAGERAEILARRAAIEAEIAALPGWSVAGSGAYFAYLQHPFEAASDQVARALVAEAGILVLPGMMFGPSRAEGGDGRAENSLRLAFANADARGLSETARRLAALPADLGVAAA